MLANSEARRKLINTERIQASEMLLEKINFSISANPEVAHIQKKIL